MNIIDRYKNQHKIILSLCSALKESSELGVNEKDMTSYLSVLKTLDEILSTHLDSEDSFLYPDLLENEDTLIKNTAKKLQDEMVSITDIYKQYKKKYINSSNFVDDEVSFLSETQFLVEALTKRIEKEEKELYSLL